MASKQDLLDRVEAALIGAGGSASVLEVAKAIWRDHRDELERSGDLFYTWQYDMRWAALTLRKRGILAPASAGGDKRWILAKVRIGVR